MDAEARRPRQHRSAGPEGFAPHRPLAPPDAASVADEPGERPELSVVVPCCNEQEVLAELYARVTAACQATGLPYEFVLVNDGSRDATWPAMLAFAESDPRVVLVNLSRNHGHQIALTAGLHQCRGQKIFILDADLQDPPELLPLMLRKLDEGADVAYGRRRRRAGESRFKTLSASAFYRLIGWLTDQAIPRDAGDFRLITRRVLDVLDAMPERRRFLRGMVSWVGFRQEPVDYDRQPRQAGETKYTLHKMIRFANDAITSFSVRPLALATWLGLVGGLTGGLLLGGALAGWLVGSASAAWVGLVAAIILMGSLQLLALGIIGAYLGRMYEQLQGRPQFVIERVVRSARPSPTPRSLRTEAPAAGGRQGGPP